jgi:hypothetical protein
MDATIYCLMDASGTVHVKDGAGSYAEVAAAEGLDENSCQLYRFDLTTRRMAADRGSSAGDHLVHAYLDRYLGTPEKLVQFAAEGHLPKLVLMNLVVPEKRQAYVDACAAIEQAYTDACAANNEPCLEGGCALDAAEGEICLQPLLHAGLDYQKSCAAEWIKLFADAHNRIDTWRA